MDNPLLPPFNEMIHIYPTVKNYEESHKQNYEETS
jgi:hypothetical protein